MTIRGGYTNYGQHIGILMLDTVFPRLPGDIGNASSFTFPVKYKVVKGALPQLVNRDDPEKELLPLFINAARELAQEGVKAITTSCGLLAAYQPELASSVNVPVFTSTLMLVPFCLQLSGGRKPVGIMTIKENSLTDRQCEGAGWSKASIPIRIVGMDTSRHFSEVYAENSPELDIPSLEAEVQDVTKQLIHDYPEIGSIVLECTNLAPFSPLIRKVSQRPVFGMDELVRFIHHSLA